MNRPPSSDTPPGPRRAPLIGLTGAPAAGKSTVAAMLREAGCHVIEVDALGHRALAEPAVRQRVAAALGPEVLAADGTLDRAAVATVAFGDADALERLEAIVHPRVRELLHDEIAAARGASARAVVLDVALLFEGGLSALCDLTVTVDAPEALRIERAAARGWDADELRRREARQLPAEQKRTRADRILNNETDLEDLRRRTLRLLDDVAPRERDD